MEPISTIVTATAVVNELTVLATAIATLLAKLGVVLASIAGVCAAIAKYTPPPAPDSKLVVARKVIDALGQNAGYAENK